MLADVLGIEISLGSTQKAWEEVRNHRLKAVALLTDCKS
jgi:tRNA G46 methylase TrmB